MGVLGAHEEVGAGAGVPVVAARGEGALSARGHGLCADCTPLYVPVGLAIFPMKSMVGVRFSAISSRKALFSLKASGLSMGRVCMPEPAAPSAPFSSIFNLALCTACGDRKQGQRCHATRGPR